MTELPDPLVQPEQMRRISAHVHVIGDQSTPGVPNVGIVVGRRKALVVDTGMGPRNGARVLAAAQAVAGQRPLLLMSTHVHPEHDLGAQAFPAETVMLRARTQVREIQRSGMTVADDFRAKSPHYRRLLEGARFRAADITFDDSLEVDLGGVRVRLTAMGTNHTEGDTTAFVQEDRMLFAGDIVMNGAPAFASPDSRIGPWLRSLARLRDLDAETIVPSHGPMGGTEMIDRYEDHLRRILSRVIELRRDGADADAVTRTVIAERAEDYGNIDRLEGAIRAALRETRGGGHADVL